MVWLRRSLLIALVPFVPLVPLACGGARHDDPPQAAPPPNGTPPGTAAGCGITVSWTPACEQVLDAMCCAPQTECARDPNCARFMQCREGCKQAAARGGKGDECIAACVPPNGGVASLRAWFAVGDCSKNLRYPQGLRCDEPF